MAEIEFSILKIQVLDHSFITKDEVRTVVERWKNKQNAHPKPRNWQFKTADARIKLKSYLLKYLNFLH